MGKEYYTIDKIVSIIKNYDVNLRYVNELREQVKRSVGVSQYGIEATMPHSNEINSVVESQALKTIEKTKHIAEKITDIKYLQQRWDRVKEEEDAMVLNLFLIGHNTNKVAEIMNKDNKTIENRVKKIAYVIKFESYPQEKNEKDVKERKFQKKSSFGVKMV